MVSYYGQSGDSGVHLPFNFQLLQCEWEPRKIAALVDEYEAALPTDGWPNWVLSNHDQPRIAARAGEEQARIAAMLLLTLRGTPTLYYGDEIGLGNVDIPADRVRDPWAKQEPDASFNRDKARTPMQWSDRTFAGFSESEPWLPLTQDWPRRNVSALDGEEGSLLTLYRNLLALRKRQPPLRTGAYRTLHADDALFAFERSEGDDRLVVILNFSSEEVAAPDLPEMFDSPAILFSSAGESGKSRCAAKLRLRPAEGVILANKAGAA